MYDVHDWAEVRRLYYREHLNKAAIARRLGMSRPTVIRLLGLPDPPRYERRPAGSKLDPHTDAIAAMLDADAGVPATVILNHLRTDGYAGGITILKEHMASLRPAFLAARSFQRTTYLPGEVGDAPGIPLCRRIGSLSRSNRGQNLVHHPSRVWVKEPPPAYVEPFGLMPSGQDWYFCHCRFVPSGMKVGMHTWDSYCTTFGSAPGWQVWYCCHWGFAARGRFMGGTHGR